MNVPVCVCGASVEGITALPIRCVTRGVWGQRFRGAIKCGIFGLSVYFYIDVGRVRLKSCAGENTNFMCDM